MSNARPQKSYRVVKIINEYKIVLNCGSEDGFCKGDELEIYVPGEPVLDPETNTVLGNLDFIKATIEIQDLFENMCVCVNAEHEKISGFMLMDQINTSSRPKRLNVEALDISGGYSKTDRKIKVGDLARKSL